MEAAALSLSNRTLLSTVVEKHSYVYNGSQLVLETVSTETTKGSSTTTTKETLHYTYDANGLPMSLTVTDNSNQAATYYYATNMQGDVTALLNTSGKAVVEYTYDAWGNPISTTGSLSDTLGETNSLRYRGYVYDTETGYYYLQSRYYNPEIGRFINADAYTSTGQELLGNNMFAYCQNNPIKYADTQGTFLNTIAGAIVGGIFGAINAAISGDNVWAGAAIGAATGALGGFLADAAIATGGVAGIAIAAVGGAVANGLNTAGNDLANGRIPDKKTVIADMVIGGVANLLTFGTGGGSLKKVGGKLFPKMVKNFTSAIMEGTTKTVAGKVVYKTTKTVVKHVAKNSARALLETGVISFGSWYNSIRARLLIQ